MIIGGIKWVKPYIPLFLIIILSAIAETICLTIKGNNLHIINIYNIADVGLIGWLYLKQFRNKFLTRSFVILLALILFFSIINIMYIQGYFEINSYFLVSKSLFIIMLSVSLLTELLSNLDNDYSIFKVPEFWIASGYLIYNGGNFFVFAYSYEIFVFNAEFPFNVWHIHSILNIILSLHLSKAILINQKNRWIKV